MKGRLTRLKALGLVKASELPPPASDVPLPVLETPLQALDAKPFSPKTHVRERRERGSFLPGWEQMAPHVFTRTVETSLVLEGEGGATFDHSHFINQRSRRKRGEDALPSAKVPYERLSFFDFETTGLSGGSGTIAFLAAIGYFEGKSFFVRQIFIDDFPGEPGFLELCLRCLAERPEIVTYNGAAFDMSLLRTRCIMNGIAVPTFSHIDLLHCTRRLWKRTLGSCSLQALEDSVLGEGREGDVPGFLIPRLWFDYSASCPAPAEESIEAMGKIADHNLLDVRSLARLFLRVERIMALPEALWSAEKACGRQLALELAAAGRSQAAFSILEEAGSEGDQTALRLLARMYRREGRLEDYVRAVESMDGGSIEGCIEKAKLYEHFKKNPEQALGHTQRALKMLGDSFREGTASVEMRGYLERKKDLERRQARLMRKMEKLLQKS
ncbi:MAG: ribonuclease H-like domain-containing protein [Spirochaetia bacterium]|jgi:uncharacterized protein YprB with RNaseH-like and TPR domain|nr:ribonuclease H-like domain-containing protein [Spirochaetia bacterium]